MSYRQRRKENPSEAVEEHVDTDTQLALLASLLEPASFPLDELKEALSNNRGDVTAAAESLLLPRVKSAGKRKAGTSLESWLGRKRGGTDGPRRARATATATATQQSGGGRKGRDVIEVSPPLIDVKERSEAEYGKPLDSDKPLKSGSSSAIDTSNSTVPTGNPPNTTPPAKPLKNAFSLLQPPSPSKRRTLPQPPILLASQSAIDAHNLPLTILQSPLSPAFASALFLAMMHESEREGGGWDRHRWFLAGRWVESPHTTANYYRVGGGYGDQNRHEHGEGNGNGNGNGELKGGEKSVVGEHDRGPDPGGVGSGNANGNGSVGDGKIESENGGGKYYYSGNELWPPKPYPDLLREAAAMIEPVVNAALESQPRHPLEYAGKWRANVCGSNRYDGAASGVGWHADQLTYLGPGATIASFSLGTARAFRVRRTESVTLGQGNGTAAGAAHNGDRSETKEKAIRTYEINLGHNTLILMNAGCQERFKHTVPPQKALDLFRPAWNIDRSPIPLIDQRAYTTRINITFRFYREDFHPSPGPSLSPAPPLRIGAAGAGVVQRQGTPYCQCGIPTLLRADQKGKARNNNNINNTLASIEHTGKQTTSINSFVAPIAKDGMSTEGVRVKSDDMVYFWQCQSPGNSGDLKGCGFFRVLDMRKEGRGPCWGDVIGGGGRS